MTVILHAMSCTTKRFIPISRGTKNSLRYGEQRFSLEGSTSLTLKFRFCFGFPENHSKPTIGIY